MKKPTVAACNEIDIQVVQAEGFTGAGRAHITVPGADGCSQLQHLRLTSRAIMIGQHVDLVAGDLFQWDSVAVQQ